MNGITFLLLVVILYPFGDFLKTHFGEPREVAVMAMYDHNHPGRKLSDLRR